MKQYDQLKKNLRGYKVAIDKEKLWQQTVHAIPQKKKRRPLVIPFLFGVLLLSGGVASYQFFAPDGYEAPNRTMLPQANVENITKESKPNVHSIANMQDYKNGTDDNEARAEIETTNRIQAHHQIPTDTKSSSIDGSPFRSPTTRNQNLSFPLRQEHTGVTLKTASDQTPALDINYSPIIKEDNRPENGTNSEIPTFHSNIHWNTSSLDKLLLLPLTYDHDAAVIDIDYSGITPASRYKNIFSLNVSQGLGFTTLSFDAGNPQAEDMRDFLTPVTRSLESVSTTVRGNVQLTKGFGVSAGIAFRQLTTETNFQNTITERTEEEGTTTIIIDEHGLQQLMSGHLGSTHIVETEYTRYATHQQVDVELMLHKRLFGFHRTTVNAYLKAGINVYYAAEGSAFTGEKELIRFQNPENPYFLRTQFTYGGGLDIQHRLSPRWILVGAAGFDQLNIYHQGYSQLHWKHTLYSLSLGMGYVL